MLCLLSAVKRNWGCTKLSIKAPMHGKKQNQVGQIIDEKLPQTKKEGNKSKYMWIRRKKEKRDIALHNDYNL